MCDPAAPLWIHLWVRALGLAGWLLTYPWIRAEERAIRRLALGPPRAKRPGWSRKHFRR